MKKPHIILNMIIPCKTEPRTDIDAYLQPLIDDLKTLWHVGVNTFDAFKAANFNLHPALFWTINDFPAYGNLSRRSTKGQLAYPVCNKDIRSRYLHHWNKQCCIRHQRFLKPDNRWRYDKSVTPPAPRAGSVTFS